MDAAYIAHLRSLPYVEYLESTWWRCRRYEAFEMAEWRCQNCGARGVKHPYLRPGHGLQAHHRSYANLGCERTEDLVVLCRGCHRRAHGPAYDSKTRTINFNRILRELEEIPS